MDAASGDSAVKVMWQPDPNKHTRMDEFRERMNEKFSLRMKTYKELYTWSVDYYPVFWDEFWKFADIVHSEPYDEVVDKTKSVADVPEWFHGSKLNFAENLLRYSDDRVAVYATAEGRTKINKRTFRQLRREVAQYAAAMRRMGVSTGDRVVGYIPNCLEAIAAMLAAASIGAVWSSTSPDFGVTGVLDRFSQIQPKLIFSVNAVIYNGKTHNHMDKLESVVQGLPDLQKVVVIPYVVKEGEKLDLSDIRNGCLLEDFLSSGLENGAVPELVFEQLPFSHPLFIMYSSGTTGVPKCMVHSAGGTLIQHLKEHILQGNMGRDDVLMYYTTTGWMMWNWFVSGLATGVALVCYDGSPLVPSANIMWDLVDKFGITILGTGAKWLQVLEEKGVQPGKTHNLQSLHTILSTGSPLKPQSYEYVYREVKKDLLLGSITGGTDIISCFAGQNWTLPVVCGEIQGPNMGMAIESWDEDGKAVIGQSGELVCTKPFPCQPTYFWNDPESTKYKAAYFDKYPGVWAHGDFCLINPATGGIWMLGRSDGTLNPNGVRFGSAEIYHVVEAFKEIQDSLCVAQRSSDGSEERVVLFLKMAPGSRFGEDVVKNVKTGIRAQLSARHVPAVVLETRDIPYTHSGKKVEVAVKKILSGADVQNRGAYANPDSLDLYYSIPELQGY